MQLERLQLDLRPRPHWQAIDLGLALLRRSAGTAYAAWLALWLPLLALTALLGWFFPEEAGWLWLPAWWLRPLLERVVIYVLSRAVFDQQVSWREALRAWPRQLGGGWFRLLTWWRPFMPGRGLYQPIWQLEQARGKFAADRRRVLGRDGTGAAAYWFGLVCAHFEVVLQLGLISLIGVFTSSPEAVNPLWMFFDNEAAQSPWLVQLGVLSYGVSIAVIGPIYTACCFTLYLNRRAALEAWDIELMLRRLAAQPKSQPKSAARAPRQAGWLLPLLLGLTLLQPEPARAAEGQCEPPEESVAYLKERKPPHDVAQQQLRARLDRVYADDDLRGYRCQETWVLKNKGEEKKPEDKRRSQVQAPPWLAELVRVLLIALAVGLVGWLLYRYRDQLAELLPRRGGKPLPAEIAGLDIRPESLPDDVPGQVLQLWRADERRAALALLYRATLSRLAHRHGVELARGATEGDCLRQAERAHGSQRIDAAVLALVRSVTRQWLDGAYALRWPADEAVEAACAAWRDAFGAAP
ncbi:DUF4129 domain-containing protein [Chitinimonas koreensis]|uniref:DUF4129 domain-containing protein n=1 Tax=Chitinimonas koreensis TaxID=356302 RepID=UPI0004222799|nr:DUF4129 domain-containing protein [Chitinimonas koreensis]QNM95778.1 DUF4129 domain-containing protein [Chitinimonas koreensis]